MVTLTPGWDEATNMDKTLLAVDDVETVEGEVTAKSADSTYNGWIKIDGERYDFANEYSQAAVGTKDDGVFYLYNGYVVHFDGEANKSDEYLYVARVGEDVDSWGDSSYTAEVVYADGTSEVIDVADGYAVGVYTYEYDEDEEYYVLDEVSTESVKVDIEKGKTGIAGDPNKATGNSDTVYVAIDLKTNESQKVTGIDDVDVYTGYRNVASMKGSAYIVKDGSVAEYVFVINGTTVGSADDLIYIAKESASELIDDADLGEYYTYNAVVDGEIVEIMVDKSAGDELDGGLYASYSVDSDDIYSKLTKAAAEDYESATGDFKKADKGVITLGNAGTMAYADDAAVYVIDTDGDITEGSVNRNYSENSTTSISILYTVNDDDEVVNVYIVKTAK